MQSFSLLLLSLILLQRQVVSTEELECYQCHSYIGPPNHNNNPRDSEASCKLDSTPLQKFLQPCGNSPGTAHCAETCALIHIEGKSTSENEEFAVTVRDCLPMTRQPMGCRIINSTDLDELLDFTGDPDKIRRMMPGKASFVKTCLCDQDGCNKNYENASSSYSISPNLWKFYTFLVILSSWSQHSM